MNDDKKKKRTVADELREKRERDRNERRQAVIEECRAILEPKLADCASCGGSEWGMDLVTMTVDHYTPPDPAGVSFADIIDEATNSLEIPTLGVFCRGCGRLSFHALRFLLPQEGKKPTLRLVSDE